MMRNTRTDAANELPPISSSVSWASATKHQELGITLGQSRELSGSPAPRKGLPKGTSASYMRTLWEDQRSAHTANTILLFRRR